MTIETNTEYVQRAAHVNTNAEYVHRVARGRAYLATGIGRTTRLDLELSLRDVAEPIGVTPSTVLKWESGSRPRAEVAARYGDLIAELRMESK